MAGSTGRQNVHGHRIRVHHVILHLQLRGFAKISRTAFQIALQTHLGVQKFESFRDFLKAHSTSTNFPILKIQKIDDFHFGTDFEI